jgi:hypothetical protein
MSLQNLGWIGRFHQLYLAHAAENRFPARVVCVQRTIYTLAREGKEAFGEVSGRFAYERRR